MGRGPEQTFFQRHTESQQTHEKMLNITNHQVKPTQNHNEISPHTCQNGYYQKDNRQRINLQNLQAARAAQYQKNKQPNPKMGRRPK